MRDGTGSGMPGWGCWATHPDPLSVTFKNDPRRFLPSSRRKALVPLVVSTGGTVLHSTGVRKLLHGRVLTEGSMPHP